MLKLFKDKTESKAIAATINYLECGRFDSAYKYIEALSNGETINLNGFSFTRSTWCYCVWKVTTDPKYKGQPLLKIVPRLSLNSKQIVKILEVQPWTYL